MILWGAVVIGGIICGAVGAALEHWLPEIFHAGREAWHDDAPGDWL